jgi:hypothetical protein
MTAPSRESQEQLNQAVWYAFKEGCFFPVPAPKKGATTQELIQWGAMRHLHTAMAEFYRKDQS